MHLLRRCPATNSACESPNRKPPCARRVSTDFYWACVATHDAELLAAKIREKGNEFRVGIDDAMGGYLLLTGNAGLDNIDAWMLKNKSADWDVYAASKALRFIWAKGNGKITKERLIHSMELLLERPNDASLGIEILATWKAWGLQERIVGMYDRGGSRRVQVNLAIIEYLLASIRANPAGSPEQVAAKKHLEQLRAKDPETVRAVERNPS